MNMFVPIQIAGFTAKTGPSTCSDAALGTIDDLFVDYTCEVESSSNRPYFLCSPGKASTPEDIIFSADDAPATACTECATGKFSVEASDGCSECTEGKANQNSGNTECNMCAAGYVVGTLNPLACSLCGAGKVQPYIHLNVSIECGVCPPGSYQTIIDNFETCGQYSAFRLCALRPVAILRSCFVLDMYVCMHVMYAYVCMFG